MGWMVEGGHQVIGLICMPLCFPPATIQSTNSITHAHTQSNPHLPISFPSGSRRGRDLPCLPSPFLPLVGNCFSAPGLKGEKDWCVWGGGSDALNRRRGRGGREVLAVSGMQAVKAPQW